MRHIGVEYHVLNNNLSGREKKGPPKLVGCVIEIVYERLNDNSHGYIQSMYISAFIYIY